MVKSATIFKIKMRIISRYNRNILLIQQMSFSPFFSEVCSKMLFFSTFIFQFRWISIPSKRKKKIAFLLIIMPFTLKDSKWEGWKIYQARDKFSQIWIFVYFLQINLLASSDHANKDDSDDLRPCRFHSMGGWCTILYVFLCRAYSLCL